MSTFSLEVGLMLERTCADRQTGCSAVLPLCSQVLDRWSEVISERWWKQPQWRQRGKL